MMMYSRFKLSESGKNIAWKLGLIVFFLSFLRFYSGRNRKGVKYLPNAIYSGNDAVGKVISRNWQGWYEEKTICDGIIEYDFILAHLNSPPNTPIYVYPAKIDEYVSFDIIHAGQYEAYNVEKIIKYLEKFPSAVFLDLGAYVGSFSIPIASLGYNVIAVECLKSSVKRLCASMEEARVSNKMTIIYNAVTDKRSRVSLQTEPGNVGMTYIAENEVSNETVNTISLDDLLEIYDFDRAILKIDVHQYEDIVLKGAYAFFDQVRVEAVLMEFVHHKYDSYDNDGKFIVDFMSKRGFEPDMPDDIKWEYKKWKTSEVLFKRSKSMDFGL